MPANLGNPSDSFAPPCRHSRESGNPVPLPALDRKAESRWVPAFAGMTIKVDQANPELEFRTPAPSPPPPAHHTPHPHTHPPPPPPHTTKPPPPTTHHHNPYPSPRLHHDIQHDKLRGFSHGKREPCTR